MSDGWVKAHRSMLENPVVSKDSDHLAVWMYLLLNATHKEQEKMFAGKKITLQPGQLITGRKKIAEEFKINESKVQRILKLFESEQQIEQQTSNANRLITIVNWCLYQENEQQNERLVNNKCTTNEQPVNTNKNERMKECKKDIESRRFTPPTPQEVSEYCKEKNYNIDPDRFVDFYTAKNWMIGKNKMKDWKAAVRSWNSRNKAENKQQVQQKQSSNKFHNFDQRQYDYGALEQHFINKANGIPMDAGTGEKYD